MFANKAGVVVTVVIVVAMVVIGAVMFWPQQEVESRPLTMAVIPTEESAIVREKSAPFAEYLSKCLDTEVRLVVSLDYTAVVEAMKYGHADIGKFGGFSYVMAVEEAGAEAIAIGLRADTGLSTYHSLLIVQPDSEVTCLEDLAGKSVAFADVGSTSGYLAPYTALRDGGIEPAETVFSGGHDASILAVINGHVDAAATSDVMLDTLLRDGSLLEDQIKIIWKSEPIPSGPLAVSKDMDQVLKEQVQRCVCSAPREVVEAFYHGRIGYIETTDAVFDVIRQMAKYKE